MFSPISPYSGGTTVDKTVAVDCGLAVVEVLVSVVVAMLLVVALRPCVVFSLPGKTRFHFNHGSLEPKNIFVH